MSSDIILILIVLFSLRLKGDDQKAGVLFGSLFLIHEMFIPGDPGYVYFLTDVLICGLVVVIVSEIDSGYAQKIMELTLVIFCLSAAGWLGWFLRVPVDSINGLAIALLLYTLIITIQRGSTHGRRFARSGRRFADFIRWPSDIFGAP